MRAVLSTRPAVQVSQKRWLMNTTEQDFRVATGELTGDRAKSDGRTWAGRAAHRVVFSASVFRWAAVRGNTEPAL